MSRAANFAKAEWQSIAGRAAPLFRGQKPRKLRTESGKEISTAQLAESLLRHGEIVVSVVPEIQRAFCKDCGARVDFRTKNGRCKDCFDRARHKHIGVMCACGKLLNRSNVCQARKKGSTPRCLACAQASQRKCVGVLCQCGAMLLPKTVSAARCSGRTPRCARCSRNVQVKSGFCACGELLKASTMSRARRNGRIPQCCACYRKRRRAGVREKT